MRKLKNKLTIIGTLAALSVIGILINSPQALQGQSSDTATAVLSEHSYTINSTDTASNPSLDQLNVSAAKTIRVNFRAALCASCSPIRVEVLSNSTLIDTFNIDIHMNTSRVYEVPGTELTLKFANTIAGASNGVVVTVLGRSN